VQWRGYIPAVTTPFTRDGALDLDAMERLLQWLLEEGMHGIIIGGTQGEWFTITAPERKQLMQIVGAS
jgi:4-hydroxy-tetrahydrodipicolinate synthase